MPYFIYCGEPYFRSEESRKSLEEILLEKMRKYRIQSALLTVLNMYRWKVVTKEKVKQAYEGKLKNDEEWNDYQQSIGDDLDTFFTNLQSQKEIKNEVVGRFFLPKLTEDELKLVEQRNEQHLSTYSEHYFQLNPDVDPEEMKKSDSRSKYVVGRCKRKTWHLTIESNARKKCYIISL